MKRRPRIVYTDSQKALMWDRWQKGESMHDIARLFAFLPFGTVRVIAI